MLLHESITQEIIKCFYQVYNSLGYGFMEKVYERALLIELKKSGLSAKSQEKIMVTYDDVIVGTYYADILVEEKIILELKAATVLMPEHEAQLLNYLKATTIEVGLLLNFGLEPAFKRKIFTNNSK
jgi:GxxExxY protein